MYCFLSRIFLIFQRLPLDPLLVVSESALPDEAPAQSCYETMVVPPGTLSYSMWSWWYERATDVLAQDWGTPRCHGVGYSLSRFRDVLRLLVTVT